MFDYKKTNIEKLRTIEHEMKRKFDTPIDTCVDLRANFYFILFWFG